MTLRQLLKNTDSCADVVLISKRNEYIDTSECLLDSLSSTMLACEVNKIEIGMLSYIDYDVPCMRVYINSYYRRS